ncbi:MAG TPA: ABC transporter substrate-binding protein [Planctomycetaceae bacterium]|nr:ABC transporter substrate-binding protein [Planctomycetaceae bacterium]
MLVALSGCRSGGPEPLVVYCAHDSVYSEEVLRRFERETGIPVSVRFDTEATKSLGLVNLLIAEKDQPRCHVFWNNLVLSTMDLADQDVLLPYKGPGWERIPAGSKDPEGRWTGFAARLRVYIVNTDRMDPTEEAIQERLDADDLSRFTIAKPLFGTTLTHYRLLWHLWGGERLKQWHRETRERGLVEAASNGQTKNLVAEGVCDFGWTDTDDFYVALDDGKPVAQVPVRVEGGATILIPNSVAIIKGTRRLEHAQRLVDFLLSEQTEVALSRSKARQIPLGPVDEAQLSDEVRPLREWAADGYDLNRVGDARRECLEWLKSEYLQ